MPKIGVKRQEGETFEAMMRRFKKLIGREGILNDYRRHLVYEKPSEIRKKKEALKWRKIRRKLQKMMEED